MTAGVPEYGHVPTLRELYPHFTDAELQEAETNMEEYLRLAVQVFERLLLDPEAYARFDALTETAANPTIDVKRSKE